MAVQRVCNVLEVFRKGKQKKRKGNFSKGWKSEQRIITVRDKVIITVLLH
jgi:hypothetical protein